MMSLSANAQSKDEQIVLAKTDLLQSTVLGTKDSAVPLDFTVTTIWIKEDGNWKLTYRKAEKNKH